jgi:ferric-dicitrate binding protein FerR (iron transport regulator)
MDKHLFIELLQKYRLGKATEEECQFLSSYYELFDQEPDVLALLNADQKEALKANIKTNIWDSIDHQEQLDSRRQVRKLWMQRFSIAAVLLVLLSTGLYFLNIAPATKAIIAKNEPAKSQRLLRLADGSTVIVSAGSKLNYPSSFDGLNKREVFLEGEAYFDIKHDASKPFMIHTDKITTTVLGTAFNIKAWPADADITVTVTRGKVKVDEQQKLLGFITPNEQIVYNKAEGSSSHRVLDAPVQLAWKEQDLLIDDVTVGEAAELLQERFKVKIKITDEQIRTKRFTTTFLKGESLDKILKSLCAFNGAVYQYDKEKASVVISSEK